MMPTSSPWGDHRETESDPETLRREIMATKHALERKRPRED